MAHVHNILDSDKRFSIDPVTRAITNESKNKVMVMQYDHNSERFTFEVDRHVEGHDMSLSTVAQIHYLNGTNEGVYEADDLQISPDDEEKVIFSWLISRNATQNPTALNFLVKFRCYEEENVVYEWNSAVFNKISVGSGMNGGEVVVEEYADILAQWEYRITALEEGAETDPTVPAWAKEATKPTYTAAEVGALPDTTVIPTVPTTVSAFTNDAGYLTAVPSEYVTETELSAKGYLISVPSEYVTETELTARGYQTASQVNTLINTALGVIENGTY